MNVRFINGLQVPFEERVISRSLDLGIGHFTTFRVRQTGEKQTILGLELHLQRLKNAGKLLSPLGVLTPSVAELERVLYEALVSLKNNNISDGRVRISCWLDVWELRAVPCEPPWVHSEASLLPYLGEQRALPTVKSTSSLLSVVAQAEAVAAGFDEGLLVDKAGIVRETCWGNFCWFDENNTLHVTKSGVLPGVTQQLVCGLLQGEKGSTICAGEVKLSEVYTKARGAFLTSSFRGPVSVTRIDDKPLPINELVTELQKLYWNSSTWLSLGRSF